MPLDQLLAAYGYRIGADGTRERIPDGSDADKGASRPWPQCHRVLSRAGSGQDRAEALAANQTADKARGEVRSCGRSQV